MDSSPGKQANGNKSLERLIVRVAWRDDLQLIKVLRSASFVSLADMLEPDRMKRAVLSVLGVALENIRGRLASPNACFARIVSTPLSRG